MKRSSFQRYSLKTRVTLFTLVMILLSIWSLTFYADRMLRQDIQHLLGTQQLATVSLMATEVNDELSSRQQALERVATQITPAMLRHPEPLQRKLESLVVLQGLFSGGVYVTGREGRALASVPVSQGMTGVNYADRDYISETLQQERPTVGRPTIGRRLKVPIVGMATPIRDPQGEVIGVLAGVINLNVPNFLDRIDLNSRHLPGNYFLVATQQRMIVASNDKSRLMEVLPAAQANPKLDRFIRGYEGTEVLVNPHGVEVLASVRHIPVAGWYAAVTLPTQEAFAPIRRLEHNMLVASVLLTLLVGGLSWWMVRRQLAPLQTTAKMLAQLADPQQPLHPLPEGRADEIGLLIGGFNRLLNELSRRQSGLQESEERYRNLTERSPDPIVVYQGETIIYANPVTVKMLGVESAEDVVGQPFVAFVHPDDRARVTETVLQGAPLGESTPLSEVRVLKADGSTMDMEIHRTSIRFDGQPAGYVAIRDISERKHVEAALRESEALYRTAFSTSPDALTITRLPDGKYLEVNEGFTRMFGWSRDEVIGKTPAELGIWHDPADRLALLQAVNDKGHCEHFETRFNCKDGNTITVLVSTNAITLNGTPCILSVTHDISARKAALKQIQQLAFSDPLTGLPNRRFFMDRMRQALAASTRHGQYGALLFVDLDDFKS
ncbi:MAG TPA: PAS domain S-box protein, partial [Burkholderiaceae bacterium]|nr:PAS domain S-box protein [Burkholderiaceae bacterium]